MSRFLLIPDLWFAPSIWQPVVALMQDKHRVHIADVFPGDHADDWSTRVIDALTRHQPDTLVVHGTSSAWMTQVLAHCAHRPARLVLIAGLGVAGDQSRSLDDVLSDHPANAIRGRVHHEGPQRSVAASVAVDAFYSHTDADVTRAVGSISIDNTLFTTPLGLLPAGVERHYIECVENQYVHIRAQRGYRDALGITLTNTLHTGHLPMLTVPEALVACIARVGINDSRYNR
ncbi:MAG: hypothetical protein AAF525_21430 [Pseudomonadota bacterium]